MADLRTNDRIKNLQEKRLKLRLKIHKLQKKLENHKCNLVDIEEEIEWHLAEDRNLENL